MIDRRTALHRTLAAAAVYSLAPNVFARAHADVPMYHTWKPVPGKNIMVAAGVSGNMVLILGKKGAGSILIDLQTAPFGQQVRREAERLGTKVELLISTHHHPEITGGNHAFTTDTGVLGRPRCKERIPGQMNRYISQVKEFLFRENKPETAKAMAAIQADWKVLHDRYSKFQPSEFAPTEVVEGEKKEIEAGGRKIVLIAVSSDHSAHTDNDLVVHLPDDDILIVGGLVAAQAHAVVDYDGGGRTAGWADSLEKLEAVAGAKTVVIPGEGKTGGSALLKEQRQYLRDLRSAADSAIAAGMSRAQVRSLTPRLRPPGGGSAAANDRLAMSLDSVYEEIKSAAAVKISPQGTPK